MYLLYAFEFKVSACTYISIWQLLSAFYFRPNIEKVMINKTVR